MREATCSCGRLRIACDGEPDIVSLCHCLDCQRRTGSAFGVQAWFAEDRVSLPNGEIERHTSVADSGGSVHYGFCRSCGSTVFWRADKQPGKIAVAVGAFADPTFPAPARSIWERRQHPWTKRIEDLAAKHAD